MKIKSMLAVLGLMLALAVVPARAQYSGSTAYNPCNTALSGGFNNQPSPLVVRFYINVHYSPKDLATVKSALATAMIDVMNARAAQQGYAIRVAATDFDSPAANLNFTIWLDAYYNDSTGEYQIYDSVGGWGQGHLFKFYTDKHTSAEDALTDAAVGTIDRFATGWTCGTQN